MLQVFLNMTVFAMNPQQAVRGAAVLRRTASPIPFEPHGYSPGLLHVESRVPQSVREGSPRADTTSRIGRSSCWRAGAVCVLAQDRTSRRDLRRRRSRRRSCYAGVVAAGG